MAVRRWCGASLMLALGAACSAETTGATPDGAPPDAGEAAADAGTEEIVVLRDGTFDLVAMDTLNIDDACTAQAPWGPDSWGIEAATFSDPDDRTIDSARFVATGQDGYLYGMEEQGRWGFVRYIQGDVWGGTSCGPVTWHRFAPLPTAGRDIRVDIEVYRDTANLFTDSNSWIMFAVNAWFSSPDFPLEGGDLNGRKPLVMDLALHHECNMDGCALRHAESDSAYHYQSSVGQAPPGDWGIFSIALAPHIDNAFAAFDLPEAARQSLRLYQLEFVIELHAAEGAATIDDFTVRLD